MGFPSDCPCKDCRNRHEKCHGECDRYQAWKYERSEILGRIHAEKSSYTNHDAQPYWRKHRKDDRRGQT